jgi:ATP-dependent Clp protease ATP-binding subunit ClpX
MGQTDNLPICNFCGKDQSEVQKLLAGIEKVYICDECVELSHNVLVREGAKVAAVDRKKRWNSIYEIPSPNEIKEHLDKHIIGQHQAKKGLAVAVRNHCKRVFHDTDIPIQKDNALILGPTGVGKTLIASTLADFLDIPFVITDATTITESGYAGDDSEVLIQNLFQKSKFDIAKTEIGIIYVDEIDKKAKRNDMVSLSRDVSGEGVQQSLLKLMEGTVVKIPNEPGKMPDIVEIDTTNILFIVSGAFVGIDDVVMSRIGKGKIGFGNTLNNIESEWQSRLETRDLVQYGLIPEFCGRLPSVNVLYELEHADLLDILTKPKYNIIDQYKILFNIDSVSLEFTTGALDAIASIAIGQDIGARGLRKILDNILLDIQFELVDYRNQNVTKLIVTRETVLDKVPPKTIKGSMAHTQ